MGGGVEGCGGLAKLQHRKNNSRKYASKFPIYMASGRQLEPAMTPQTAHKNVPKICSNTTREKESVGERERQSGSKREREGA